MKKSLILPGECDLSIERQCELLSLPRSTYYYEPCREDAFNLAMMKEIDLIYTEHPYYGKRRISVEMKKLGHDVGVDLARTLMRRMGIEAIYPKPNLSKPHSDHKVYPYLLRGVPINRVNQVWSTDITYIRMRNGFLYLTAVIDWYSRYVLAWKLSNSLDGRFCREVLLEAGIQISMDGRGRALDNVWMERLWRSVKQEEVYIHDYEDGLMAHRGLGGYFYYYNEKRPHSSLGYMSPGIIYRG